jgi:hypothetical protein
MRSQKQLSLEPRITTFTSAGVAKMKNPICLRTGLGVLLFAIAIPSVGESRLSASADSKNTKPVIVELFTSEGCSSCPPADALLLKLESSQTVQGVNVIAIEEHVDYWNHDGWTDPYSSADWTQRQIDYVSRFKDKQPYTPQLIVDGQVEMTGGQEQKTEQAIQQAATQPKTEVTLSSVDSTPDETQINVKVGKLTGSSDRDTAEVWMAITESGLASTVDAGENAGKNLHHASVLRTLRKIGVANPKNDSAYESVQKLKLKSAWKRQNLQVAVFVQEKKSMRILGAATVGVS